MASKLKLVPKYEDRVGCTAQKDVAHICIHASSQGAVAVLTLSLINSKRVGRKKEGLEGRKC